MNRYIIFILISLLISSSGIEAKNVRFADVVDGQFFVPSKVAPYYYVGTNFWYGALLGSQDEGGDRERLIKELDYMKSIGIDNLRVLVGSEGDPVHSKVVPILQPKPGVYDQKLLEGLDFLMAELAKRDMYAVLYLNNSWEWSGGYCQYLEWTGRGKYPIPGVDGWDAYMTYVKQYHAVGSDDPAKRLFADHVKFIVGRKNSITGRKYRDDPAIFSWQIANEPRAFDVKNKETFALWTAEIAALIKSIDPNHMVSTGSEGSAGCEFDIELWERIHADANIDYANIHMWPYNWRWIKIETMEQDLSTAKENSLKYINDHLTAIKRHKKPIVLEEFGFPRDKFLFAPTTATTLRDQYYQYIFDILVDNARSGGDFTGCNFWAWGGFGTPAGVKTSWSKGDDYLGDPAQEEQGLNSVFATDKTIEIIRRANADIAASGKQILSTLRNAASKGKFLFGQQDFPFYGFNWTKPIGRSDVYDVVGDYPAVLGVDLGEIELRGKANLDGVLFSDMRKQIIEQHKRGGLTSISWHPRNPLTKGDAWDVSSDRVVASVLPSGQNHELFKGWLNVVSDFIASLKDDKGQKIDVIFRPWHEHTGSWFWWGERLCSQQEYVALWHSTIEHMRARGADNMVIAYSPSLTSEKERYMDRYPGDSWVDILGVDAYHGDAHAGADKFSNNLLNSLVMMSEIGAEHNKLIALTETGSEALPMSNWWTQVLCEAVRSVPVSYVLVWRNANKNTKQMHFYAPYPGQGSEKDFIKFYNMPQTIFTKDLTMLN